MNRPFAWVATALLAGTLAGAGNVMAGIVIPSGLVAVSCLLALCALSEPRIRPVAVALCFIGCGALLWNLRVSPTFGDALSGLIAQSPQKEMEVSGRVRSTQLVIPQQATDNDHKPLPPRQVFLLDVESVNDGAVSITGRAIVYWAHPGALVYPGDYVSLAGKGSVALGNVNPGVRGYEDYLRNWGIHSGLECAGADAVTVTAQATRLSPGYWAARFRQAQADRLALVMPERVLDFVYAVWLGQQSVLGYREYRSYVASGTAHILSVSGVHAGIVFLTLNFALRAMQVRRAGGAFAKRRTNCPAVRRAN